MMVDATRLSSHKSPNSNTQGAIGFDWFTAGWGGVSWLISRPR